MTFILLSGGAENWAVEKVLILKIQHVWMRKITLPQRSMWARFGGKDERERGNGAIGKMIFRREDAHKIFGVFISLKRMPHPS